MKCLIQYLITLYLIIATKKLKTKIMAYNKKKIYEKAQEIVKKNNLFFIQDIIALLGISRQTFYDFFPLESDELDTLKEMLENNRARIKCALRSKWFNSENATTQVALYKLVSNEDERKLLSTTYQEVSADIANKDKITKLEDVL